MVELATICAPVVEQLLQNLADAQKANAEAVKLQAQSQIHAQEQETKRCELRTASMRQIILVASVVYVVVAVLAEKALSKGEVELTRNLITGLLTSLGTVLGLLLGLLHRSK